MRRITVDLNMKPPIHIASVGRKKHLLTLLDVVEMLVTCESLERACLWQISRNNFLDLAVLENLQNVHG